MELQIAMVKIDKIFQYGRYSKAIMEDAMKRLGGGE